jgi:hypothetical protein
VQVVLYHTVEFSHSDVDAYYLSILPTIYNKQSDSQDGNRSTGEEMPEVDHSSGHLKYVSQGLNMMTTQQDENARSIPSIPLPGFDEPVYRSYELSPSHRNIEEIDRKPEQCDVEIEFMQLRNTVFMHLVTALTVRSISRNVEIKKK